MAAESTYFVSRVAKTGTLDSEGLIQRIYEAGPYPRGTTAYSFVDLVRGDVVVGERGYSYLFGRISRFLPNGQVPVVDPSLRTRTFQSEPNLEQATSCFVYLPDFSTLAFQQVSKYFQINQFPLLFQRLVMRSTFFEEVDINPIADLGTFVGKVKALKRIDHIKARVHPPNPLFGGFWASLKDYLARRNAVELKVDEKAKPGQALASQLPSELERLSSSNAMDVANVAPLELGDAAVAMAADGYGSATVTGTRGSGKKARVRTADANLSFAFSANPDPEDLAARAVAESAKVSESRGLRH